MTEQDIQAHCSACHDFGDDVPELHYCIVHSARHRYPGGCCCHAMEELQDTWQTLMDTGE